MNFKQSIISFLLLVAGLTSFYGGYSLLFDDRKLNRWLLSVLLMLCGIILISDGLIILGLEKAENLKNITLVCLSFVGLISSKIIRDYKNERIRAIHKREIEKAEEIDDQEKISSS